MKRALSLLLPVALLFSACEPVTPEAPPQSVAQAPRVAPMQAPHQAAPGQKKSAAKKEDPKNADIRKLLVLTGSGKLGKQSMEYMLGTFRQTMPQVPAEFWDEFSKEVSEDDLINLVIPVYARHYSHDEIKELIAFYESPVGKKSVEVMPQIMQESQQAGEQWGRELAQKVQKRLKEKGYDKK